jgi:RNA polymerase sigma-70 factor, ECF subfamily
MATGDKSPRLSDRAAEIVVLSPPVEDLVANIRRGKEVEESFRHLYTRYYARVIRLFQRRGLSMEESRDLAQETFLRLFRSIESFRSGEGFDPWLFGIANNVYRNVVRQKTLPKRAAAEVHLEEESDASTVPAVPGGPLEDLLNTERAERLHRALAELPPQMRVCIDLRLRGYKYREIAILMRISIQTVKAHLHQARLRLMQQFAGEDPLVGLDD